MFFSVCFTKVANIECRRSVHVAVTVACVCTCVSRVRCHFKAVLVVAFLLENSVKRWFDASGNIRHVAARTDVNISRLRRSLGWNALCLTRHCTVGLAFFLCVQNAPASTVIFVRIVGVLEERRGKPESNEFTCFFLNRRSAWSFGQTGLNRHSGI